MAYTVYSYVIIMMVEMTMGQVETGSADIEPALSLLVSNLPCPIVRGENIGPVPALQ